MLAGGGGSGLRMSWSVTPWALLNVCQSRWAAATSSKRDSAQKP